MQVKRASGSIVQRLFDAGMVAGGVISFALCAVILATTNQDQSQVWILPLSFLLAYLLFLRRAVHKGGAPIVAVTSSILFFISVVVYPALIATVGENYIGRQYIPVTQRDMDLAIYASALSVLAGSAFLGLLSSLSSPDLARESLVMRGHPIVYWGVILLAAAGVVLVELPEGSIGIAFLMTEVGARQEELMPLQLMVRKFIVVTAGLSYMMALYWSARGYRSTAVGKLFYVVAALVAGTVLVSLVVGDRRSVQVLTGLTVMVLSVRLFPEHRRWIIGGIVGAMLFVVMLMTVTRYEAEGGVDQQFSDLIAIAETVQIYFSGVESVATNIALSKYVSVDFQDFIFDFARSTFGLNFMLRDVGPLTSQLYNMFLYNQRYETGQLLFAPGYGYIYFGFWLSPLMIMLNILIAYCLEILYRRTSALELAYLYLYCLFRTVVLVLVNTPMILTAATLQLATFGIVIFVATLLRGRGPDAVTGAVPFRPSFRHGAVASE